MGTLPITQAIIRGLFLAAATGDPRAPRVFTERPQDATSPVPQPAGIAQHQRPRAQSRCPDAADCA